VGGMFGLLGVIAMETLLQKLLNWELRSLKTRNPKLDLIRTALGAFILGVILLTTSDHGFWGLAMAGLYVWHRYVVLNLVEKQQ
jgi:hypothetical protein